MSEEKKAYVVSILNQKLSVRSDTDEAHVLRVADFVNQRIQAVVEQTKNAPFLTAALLACLNIADELFKYRKGQEVLSTKVEKKVKELMASIDLAL